MLPFLLFLRTIDFRFLFLKLKYILKNRRWALIKVNKIGTKARQSHLLDVKCLIPDNKNEA